ncbi:MAG: GntR family transcriptional regulator [Coprococcus sp.]
MDFKANIPIYLQVIQDIKNKIVTGKLPLGSKLPSSRELAVMYGINPNTAARIYNEMEAEGISFTRRGIGTFVTDDTNLVNKLKHELLDDIIMDFTEKIEKLGYSRNEIMELLHTFYNEHPQLHNN